MEISFIEKDSIRLKGKQTSFLVNPFATRAKNPADASLYLSKKTVQDVSKVEGNRLTLQGAGEYEVGGVKITAYRFGEELGYDLKIDGLEVFVANATVLEKAENLTKSQEALREYHIVVLQVDVWPNESIVPSLSPSVVVLFGAQAQEAAKKMGVENIAKTSKYVTTLEKLPQEMEVVVLG